jgi:hypothetical protein
MAVFAVRVSRGGLTAAPDTPPASDNAPATPNTVKAFVRPLRFEFLRFEFRLPRDMVDVSHFTPACNYTTTTTIINDDHHCPAPAPMSSTDQAAVSGVRASKREHEPHHLPNPMFLMASMTVISPCW